MNRSWPPLTTSNSVYGNFPMYNKRFESQPNNNNAVPTTLVYDNDDGLNPSHFQQPQSYRGENELSTNPVMIHNPHPIAMTEHKNNDEPVTEYLQGEEPMSELNKYVPNYHQQFYPCANDQFTNSNPKVGSDECGSSNLLTEQPFDETQNTAKVAEQKTVTFESNAEKRPYRSKSHGRVRKLLSTSPQQQQPSIYQVIPKAITGIPSTPQMNLHSRLTTSQMKQTNKQMTNKPKFHLCGKCTKCKIIQGNPTALSASTSAIPKIFQKSNERGYSTTIFPR